MISKTRALGYLLSVVIGVFWFVGLAVARGPGIPIKSGDVLSIHVVGSDTLSGKFVVLSDGTVESHSFGSVKVEGLSADEAAAKLQSRLKAKLKDPVVSVVIDLEATTFVYVSGTRLPSGVVKWVPNMDLRQLLVSAEADSNADLSEAHLFRPGQPELKVNVQDVLNGSSPYAVTPLKPNDVIAVLPLEFVRVWVTGEVAHPGQYTVRKGDDLYRAIASAGGATVIALADNDSKIMLRRGPGTKTFPIRELTTQPGPTLESGDTIVVSASEKVTVTVSGEVRAPGRVELRSTAVLEQAIAGAGGLTGSGTGRDVTILRDGQTLNANVASSTSAEGLGTFKVKDHDVILVRQNTRFAIVVGIVKTPGRVYIPDGQPIHLLDAIIGAGGIADRGTARHVVVGHPDKTGRLVMKEFRLDRYLKNGDQEGNPLIEAGDIVTVQAGAQTTVDQIQQVLSGAVLLYGVSKL